MYYVIASLSFRTVTLRFLGTELICVARRCVHRFLLLPLRRSPSLCAAR